METQEIPHEQWIVFLDSFSHQHNGWLATLEVLDTEFGAQSPAQDLPFEGISLNSKEGRPESILISVGRSVGDHLTHRIDHPTHIWLQRAPSGADSALEIESDGDSKTLLRFRSAMSSEFVDDIVV